LAVGHGHAVELPRVDQPAAVADLGLAANGVRASCPSPATTRTIGRSNFVANSKSRSSCPGTAMIAPVPYSMST
jgi:hypothetical protein